MAEARLSLELKNDISQLDILCEKVEAFCSSHGLSEKSSFEISLVMDELFTNIVSYGFDDKGEHLIKIEMDLLDKNKLRIRVEDDGVAFNPIKVETPVLKCCLEDRKIGGLGLHLVHKLMSRIVYKRRDEKNVLILTKRLSKFCK